MRHARDRFRWAVTGACALLVMAGVRADPVAGDPIRIGVAGPMDGDQGKMGQDILHGVQLAVDQRNASGGVLGRPVAIEEGNDQHDPRQAVLVANKFVNSGVVGVVGHFNSDCSIPASTVYADAGIPQITPASTNPQFTERGLPSVFRVCGRDDQQGRVAADFVVGVLERRRVAVLHDRTTYGQGLAQAFTGALRAHGVEPVYEGGIVQGEQDYRSAVGVVREASPEVLFFGGIYREGALLLKQAREQGLDAVFVSGDGVIDQTFVRIAGDAAEGSYLTFTPDVRNLPGAGDTIRAYEERFGELGPYSVYGYIAAQILMDAIQSAGSPDGEAVGRALHAGTFRTALGEISFDEKGDTRGSPYVVYVTRGGTFVQHTGLDGAPLAR